VPICDQKSYDISSEYGSEIPIKKYFGGLQSDGSIIRSRSWSRSRKNIFGSTTLVYDRAEVRPFKLFLQAPLKQGITVSTDTDLPRSSGSQQ